MKVIGTDGKEYTIEPRVDLSGTDLSEASLECALYTDGTKFPEGFEIPEKSGT